jgi:hypothetical protein
MTDGERNSRAFTARRSLMSCCGRRGGYRRLTERGSGSNPESIATALKKRTLDYR